MKKLIATVVAGALLCPIANAQSAALEAVVTDCRTLTVTLPEPAPGAEVYRVVWLERRVAPGLWRGVHHVTTRARTAAFTGLPAGDYRVLATTDIHESIYYSAAAVEEAGRLRPALVTLAGCSQSAEARTEGPAAAVQLFPNPTTGLLYLRVPEVYLEGGATLALVDLAGKTVFTQALTAMESTADVSRLGSGAYTAVIRAVGTEVFRRLVVVQNY